MDVEKKIELITRNVEEVLTIKELRSLLEQGVKLKHYIGFEISGEVHLGTGISNAIKIKDFLDAGVDCSIFLADWHSWINDKLSGDLDTIKNVAGGYFKEAMLASLKCVGGYPKRVKFVLGSELYHNNDEYWRTVIDISKHITLSRTMRSITIMGRKEGEAIDFAKLIYPPMQVADIFVQGINIVHAGVDQRSAHVIARDVALKLKKYKPIAIHQHLLLGLRRPPEWPIPKNNIKEIWSRMKMSKSIPSSAVFIHDTPEEIRKKLLSAFCPERNAEFNPVLDWAKYLIFITDKTLKIERKRKYGGDIVFNSYDELERSFVSGDLHPLDLKNGVAEALIKLLEPARKHFAKSGAKRKWDELKRIKITR